MTEPFPTDVTFIQDGRLLEVEAFDSGRRSNQIAAVAAEGLLAADDDIVETEERIQTVATYLAYAQTAFDDRDLKYPFRRSLEGDSLRPLEGLEAFAKRCSELSDLVGKNNSEDRLAKSFERRAVEALHRFLGGWAVNVGAPRDDRSGPKRAVRQFRQMLGNDGGDFLRSSYPKNGDLGADALWILGKTWGGPIVFFQAKNCAFSIRDVPEEFHRASDILFDWFGRQIAQCRTVIRVYAVNTLLTNEFKVRAYQAGSGGPCIHVLDAADILAAEELPSNYKDLRDKLTLM
jgi:hypothetical protein